MSNLFSRMTDGYWAELEAERRIAEILGVEDLLGIGWDDYDDSFEIYPLPEFSIQRVTPEQHDAILALGCLRFWINFPDGTEICGNTERIAKDHNSWEAFNRMEVRRGERAREIERLRAAMQNAADMIKRCDYVQARSELLVALAPQKPQKRK